MIKNAPELLSMLLKFYSMPALARLMQTTIPTLYRWKKKEGQPRDNWDHEFRSAINHLSKQLRAEGHDGIADAVAEYAVITSGRSREGGSYRETRGAIKKWLTKRIPSGERVLKVTVIEEGLYLKFNPRTIQRAATEMGIKSKTVGFGAKKRAYWSRP